MSAIFLETSALLRIVFGENGGIEAAHRLAGTERIVASRLLVIETERALLRRAQDDPAFAALIPAVERELRELWSRTSLFELTREICELAGRIAPRSRLRTLDAIHLATYQRVRRLEPSIEMLTFDKRLLEVS